VGGGGVRCIEGDGAGENTEPPQLPTLPHTHIKTNHDPHTYTHTHSRTPPHPHPHPPTHTQINPPKPGSPSHTIWRQEQQGELQSLRKRAHMVTDGFNSLPGVTCNLGGGGGGGGVECAIAASGCVIRFAVHAG